MLHVPQPGHGLCRMDGTTAPTRAGACPRTIDNAFIGRPSGNAGFDGPAVTRRPERGRVNARFADKVWDGAAPDISGKMSRIPAFPEIHTITGRLTNSSQSANPSPADQNAPNPHLGAGSVRQKRDAHNHINPRA